MELINRFYHYYQIKKNALQRFKFILKNDINFNYKIIVDIIYLDFKPVLYIIDANIAFQITRFLNNILAKKYGKY